MEMYTCVVGSDHLVSWLTSAKCVSSVIKVSRTMESRVQVLSAKEIQPSHHDSQRLKNHMITVTPWSRDVKGLGHTALNHGV